MLFKDTLFYKYKNFIKLLLFLQLTTEKSFLSENFPENSLIFIFIFVVAKIVKKSMAQKRGLGNTLLFRTSSPVDGNKFFTDKNEGNTPCLFTLV